MAVSLILDRGRKEIRGIEPPTGADNRKLYMPLFLFVQKIIRMVVTVVQTLVKVSRFLSRNLRDNHFIWLQN